jgi:hypothetical protein
MNQNSDITKRQAAEAAAGAIAGTSPIANDSIAWDDDSASEIDLNSRTVAASSSGQTDEGSGPVKTHTEALGELLRASRVEFDGLLSKTQEIQERSWQMVQSLFEGLHLRVSREFEDTVASFAREIHDRAAYEASAVLENFDIEARSRLAARVDEALARIQQSGHRMEQELNAGVAENQKELAEISLQAREESQQQQRNLLVNLQDEAKKKFDDLMASTIDETAKNAREMMNALTDELRKCSEQALQAFQVRVESLGAAATSETEKLVATTTKSVLANIAEQTRETFNQEVSEFLIQALHNRLDQLGSALKQTGTDANPQRREEASETELETDGKVQSLSREASGIVTNRGDAN